MKKTRNDTEHLLSSTNNQKHLMESIAQLKSGKLKTFNPPNTPKPNNK